MKGTLVVSFGLLALFCAGCAGTHSLNGKQTVVSSMPETRPDWVSRSSYEEKGRIWYRGAVTGRHDMSLGLREARGEAEKQLAEAVRVRIRTEFGNAIQGQNEEGSLGRQVNDLIAKISDEVEVSGATQSETYMEKLEERLDGGVRYVWDCYALLSLSKEDYLEARRRTFDGALYKARKELNAKAEAALKAAFAKLESSPLALGAAVPVTAVAAPAEAQSQP